MTVYQETMASELVVRVPKGFSCYFHRRKKKVYTECLVITGPSLAGGWKELGRIEKSFISFAIFAVNNGELINKVPYESARVRAR